MVTEALDFLIRETNDPRYMMELGGLYYGRRDFDLALKYYEMAAESDYEEALTCLGYVWYYGRTGTKDYEKAFKYFDHGRKLGDPVATYKVADMYKNGYYVEKDPDKYKAIIEELYREYKDFRNYHEPLPEIFTRLAGIRTKEGKIDEALELYDKARYFLAKRIRANAFFGNLNIMKWTINDIYELREFDKNNFSLYDLYYLLVKPCKVRFRFEGKDHEIESTEEDGEIVIRFDDRWYRTIDDLFKKAELDGERLVTRERELKKFEVI